MQIQTYTLEDCAAARGVVVVIDVMRAFTAAAYAFAAGAEEILLAGTVEEALQLGSQLSGQKPVAVMGESGGMPVAGFDYDNSPSQLAGADLHGHTVVQRTTSGVQGLLRCGQADTLLAGSFVVAGATLQRLRELQPERLSLVITGDRPGYRAVEDHALADYLQAALRSADGQPPDPEPYLQQARGWFPTPGTGQGRDEARLQRDLALCSQLDTFHFALPVERRGEQLVLLADPRPMPRPRNL
jgi:2-phosphosulfolactate phosphatase